MSEQHQSSSGGGKVTILSSGEAAQASSEGIGSGGASAAASNAAKSAANSRTARRKVGTNLERSFVDPGAGPSRQQHQQDQQQPRQVLKAGKPIASAPTPMQQRPMTELEKAFSEKTVQDQRWLLSFPLALKQLYFGFAESTNHEHTLTTLINRFPELLAGSDQHPSAILVAIQKGNWTPAMHFITACIKGKQARQLVQRFRSSCGTQNSTFLIEAVHNANSSNTDKADLTTAINVMTTMAEACPELLTAADSVGRNPLHYSAEQPNLYTCLLLPLLTELRQLALNSQIVALRLGNALATEDSFGKKPIDLLSTTSDAAAKVHEAMQHLMKELPTGGDDDDEAMTPSAAPPLLLLSGAAAKDAICSALAQRQKAAEFVSILVSQLRTDPRAFLLETVEQPERLALDYFGKEHAAIVKQALVGVALGEFCDLVDRL